MIKQWYTARELAEFELDGMPKSEYGFKKKIDRENWQGRNRNAVGGGKEYHVSNLPDLAQMSLIERAVGQQRLKELECHSAAYQMKQERGRAKFTNEERLNARLAIVSLFENFRASMGMGVLAAEQPFLKLYKAERNKGNSAIIPDWIFDIHPELSGRSLHRWRSSRKSATSMQQLGKKRGKPKGSGILERANDGDVANYIVALITKQSHLTAGHVRDMCFSKFGKTVEVANVRTKEIEQKPFPKIRAFERFIARWKEENKGLFLNLTDPDAYKNKYQAAFGSASAGIKDLNQLWEIDASPVDAMCKDGRHNLYAIIDVFSRRPMFLVTKTAATEGSLSLIRRAVLKWGVPDTIKTDNGSDFTSYRFQNALMSLDIHQSLCTPFTPESKPHVERVFKTLQHDLMPLLSGFIGHNVADRSKIEKTKAFSQRLGESDKDAFGVDMTSEELQAFVDQWAEQRYGDRVHGSIKETPNMRAQNWVGSIKKIENERVLDVLLAPIATGKGYRQVTKTGIRTDGVTFYSEELSLHIGEQVFVRHNPTDMGRIYVFHAETHAFICEAINPESLGVSSQEVAAAAKAKQKEKIAEERKAYKKIQRSIKPRDMINAVLDQHAKAAENIVQFRPTQTHVSAGITEAQKALDTFEPIHETQLDAKQKTAHQKIIDDLSGAKKPVIVSLNSKETRTQRAASLESRLEKGDRISADDQRWLSKYQTLPEYIAAKRMQESFGDNKWFEDRGEY